MRTLEVSALLGQAVKSYSENDLRNAITLCGLIMRITAERLHVPTSLDYCVALRFATLTALGFQVSKEVLRRELIFDFKRLARLSNPPKAEILRWIVWCMNDYLSLTGKSCKEFMEFKRRYMQSIRQKSI